jgi:glycerol-1-phosphate dehydrogenase [NAD(P)+]
MIYGWNEWIASNDWKEVLSKSAGYQIPHLLSLSHHAALQAEKICSSFAELENFNNNQKLIHLLIVADENTWPLWGKSLAEKIAHHGVKIDSLVLKHPYAEMKTVKQMLSRLHGVNALLAVGSGTINDLTKYTAHLAGLPYGVVATAPSMNGYVSSSAAIMEDGIKRSLPATLPHFVVIDADLLATAPKRLLAAGAGDALCRSTARWDWLLSHWLLGTSYEELPFDISIPREQKFLVDVQGSNGSDTQQARSILELLLLSGLGMVVAGGSFPASQGEHLLAHAMEMLFSEISHQSYHGEQIAVTSLIAARLQSAIETKLDKIAFESDRAAITPYSPDWQAIAQENNISDSMMKTLQIEWQAKDISPRIASGEIVQKIRKEWPEWKEKLRRHYVPEPALREALATAGAPLTPLQLGWQEPYFSRACSLAPFIRSRFTCLDMALYLGIELYPRPR